MFSMPVLRSATQTPAKAAAAALLWVGLAIVLINLFLNRPDHDHILGIDATVAGVNLVLAAVVFTVAARVGDRTRGAIVAAVTLSILLVLTAPVYYFIPQPVLGLGAILVGSRPALRQAHGAVARTAVLLGVLGLIGNLVFVGATVVHFLAT